MSELLTLFYDDYHHFKEYFCWFVFKVIDFVILNQDVNI